MIYKVIVVDDSALMRAELSRIIQQDPKLEVVDTARNGSSVLDLIKKHNPDVITLDIEMPVMNGIETLKKIMAYTPMPVVMISQLTSTGADETIESLHLGAFDFIHKPSGSLSLDMKLQSIAIRNKIKLAAINRNRIKIRKRTWQTKPVKPPFELASQAPVKIVAIAASTGGPSTLLSVLPKLPSSFNSSLIIAQHMPAKFTATFAKRLDGVCNLNVKEAMDGEIVKRGYIYIAPGGKHIKLFRQYHLSRIQIIDEITHVPYKPSADILFDSLIEHFHDAWIGVILTGMGSDGANGLAKLRELGGHTIAESENSCVVYGMPKKAIELGAAEFIIDEDQIASKIIELTHQ